MKTYKLEEVEDNLIGKIGTPDRDNYELKIKLIEFGQLIKQLRKEKKITQVELAKLVEVPKSEISKLEKGTSEMAIGIIFRIFEVMKSELEFKVKELEFVNA